MSAGSTNLKGKHLSFTWSAFGRSAYQGGRGWFEDDPKPPGPEASIIGNAVAAAPVTMTDPSVIAAESAYAQQALGKKSLKSTMFADPTLGFNLYASSNTTGGATKLGN